MAFQHATIFWTGLGAATVPIIIHLLNRTRFRPRVWAAMQFLLESLRKNRRRLQIEELILLALRCAILLLLAVALARFSGCAALSVLPGRGSDNQVLFLLDDSLSTGQRRGDTNLFSKAAGDLADLIEQVHRDAPGSWVGILRTSETARGRWLLPAGELKDPEAVVAKLRTLRPGDTRNDLAESLGAIREGLRGGGGSRELVILSDFRRIDLLDKETIKRIQKELSALAGAGVHVTALDYGREPERNLTAEKIELTSRYVLKAGKRREPARMRLTVRNNGTLPARDVEVSLEAVTIENGQPTGQPLPARRIARIDPGSSEVLEFTYAPLRSGPVTVVARLVDDELTGDNTARIVLDVREDVRVLVVDGNLDPADPERSEAFYFTYAIDPTGDGQYGAKADVIDPRGLPAVKFNEYDAVALLDVRAFPAQADGNNGELYPSVAALERYVRRGGGLVTFTGEKVSPEFYNKRLYAEGAGLSPLLIQPRKGDATTAAFVRLDGASILDEPPMQVFTYASRQSVDLTKLLRFYAYNPSQTAPPNISKPYAKPPRVLARFADPGGSPAVVSRDFGAGKTLMVYTSASSQWNDWPSDPNGSNVVFLQDTILTLGRPQLDFTGRVGSPIVYELPTDLPPGPVSLRTPSYPAADMVALATRTRAEELAGRLKELAAQADKGVSDDVRLGEALVGAAQAAVAEMDGRDAKAAQAALAKVQPGLVRKGAPGWAGRAAEAIAEVLEDEPEMLAVRRVAHRDCDSAGVYVLTLAPAGLPERTLMMARNVDPAEGRLAHGGREDVAAAFGAAAGDWRYIGRADADRSDKMTLRPEREYWAWAVGAMLALLTLECFLAQRFGHHRPARPEGQR